MYSWNERYLMKDEKPILPIMGEFHFSRYPKTEWKQELLKMKAGGIEIAATYVFWIHHEEAQGEWDFTGNRCLRDFLHCCQETDIAVWLRIGPWAHGECRNGGFPDWLVQMERDGKLKTREDHPAYLKLVDKLFTQIGIQAEGMMYKDGGPIIGIQIENEYGHCGGPSDQAAGMKHMNTLETMAMEKDLIAPYYSATGWGGAYVPEGMLAVLGGYVDAPWEQHIHELKASENFLFMPFHDDANIGSDLKEDKKGGFTFDTTKLPYLTAELGGGLEVTGHRRTYPYPEDIEAQTICMLGAGANMIGYYMYHGGVNPDGRYSTLQETRATGYNNDLPEKSYDFQTCLRETGLPSESYYRLRKIHMFIKSVEELLAPAIPYLPEEQPSSPEDMTTLRASLRYNKEADCGFLFINNHQRKRVMTEKWITEEKPLKIWIQTLEGSREAVFKHIHVPTDACMILPYHFPIEEYVLMETNASYLGCFSGKYYFYTDDEPYFFFSGKDGEFTGIPEDLKDKIKILSVAEAEHAYAGSEGLEIKKGIVIDKNREYQLVDCGEALQINSSAVDNEGRFAVNIVYEEGIQKRAEDIYLSISFGGDSGRIYSWDNKLLTDWFSNGEDWVIALKRYGYPEKLKLELFPFKENVYYDLKPRQKMGVNCITAKMTVATNKL